MRVNYPAISSFILILSIKYREGSENWTHCEFNVRICFMESDSSFTKRASRLSCLEAVAANVQLFPANAGKCIESAFLRLHIAHVCMMHVTK